MSDRTRDAKPASGPTTILDPLRPAVVVRRRVYDAASSRNEEDAARAFISTTEPPVVSHVEEDDDEEEEDENGPPSSINVARAIASLRADELARVEELVRADEEAEAEAEAALHAPVGAPPAPAVPTIMIGKSIALSELAERLGVPANELPATLVARGFYAMTAKTVLPRETARVIAEMFGWRVEFDPNERDEAVPVKSGTRSRLAPKRKHPSKPPPAPKATAKTKTGTRRRVAR
jgi:hypothetical protein